jgi:hypothetical protein
MTIFTAHHGGAKFTTIGECVKVSLGCISPESINQIPTGSPMGQSRITVAQLLGNLRANRDKLAVGDVITTNVIPTKSYLDGVAIDMSCKLDGFEFEFVTVKQNGIDAAGDPAFTVAPLAAGKLNISSYAAVVAGIVTETSTASNGAPPAFGTAGASIVYSPAYNANYFGSWGALAIKVTAIPTAAAACNQNQMMPDATGACAMITATWRNISPCVRRCADIACADKGNDVIVLA